MRRTSPEDECLLSQVTPRDLVSYGMIPEFIGRLPITVALHPLAEDALVSILTQPKNSLVKQYQALFATWRAPELSFMTTRCARSRAAPRSARPGRALRAILEEVMLDMMFDLPQRVKLHVPGQRRCGLGKAHDLHRWNRRKVGLSAARRAPRACADAAIGMMARRRSGRLRSARRTAFT